MYIMYHNYVIYVIFYGYMMYMVQFGCIGITSPASP